MTELAKRVHEAAKTIQDLRAVDQKFPYLHLAYEGKGLGSLLSEAAKRVEEESQVDQIAAIVMDNSGVAMSTARRIAEQIVQSGFRNNQ